MPRWATVISWRVLVLFRAPGQMLLGTLGVGLDAIRRAGPLVLLLFALSMSFDTVQTLPPTKPGVSPMERAVFPLAMPSIAGPGTMLTVVVLGDTNRFNRAEQGGTALALLLVLVLVYLVMRFATPLVHLLRRAGISTLSRLTGLSWRPWRWRAWWPPSSASGAHYSSRMRSGAARPRNRSHRPRMLPRKRPQRSTSGSGRALRSRLIRQCRAADGMAWFHGKLPFRAR